MRFLGWVLLAALVVPLPAAARCLTYEPAIVTLKGALETKVVPGPPGYTSMARGDLPETIVLLTLDSEICVLAKSGTVHNTRSHPRVKEVQIEMDPIEARKFNGKRIRSTGSLYGAHTGHHRTPVILRPEIIALDHDYLDD